MWEPDFRLESVPCPRAKYRNQLPESCFSSGHVAAGLDNFQSLLPGCSSILSASAASTFFPGRNHWLAKSRALFDQWLKRHRLPNTLHPMFEDFCKEQWQQHVGALEHSSRLNWAMLQQVKSTLQKDFVLYNVLVFYFVDCAPHGMTPQYSGAWRAHQLSGKQRCSRHSILKRKKQFIKGRTIISYSGSLCSKLLELASVALTLIVKTLYADNPGLLSMPQLWQAIHTSLVFISKWG